ncbi:MAG: hypothetical protein CMJ48_14360 [Planctomycetaceae bacterium]|nr:hypothetical protein [Planctomycetaceae bacterium]
MRIVTLLVWLMLPVLAAAYHYGPGQRQLLLDDVDGLVNQAEKLAQQEQWSKADAAYEEALGMLPDEGFTSQRRRLRLERAKVQMENRELPSAHQELKQLVDEMTDDKQADSKLLSEARSTLGNSQYYMTWLMRLEGRPRADWEPEIEAARQTFRLLAEQSEQQGAEDDLKRNREDPESSIRLARMDLKDLQGLPLPSQ